MAGQERLAAFRALAEQGRLSVSAFAGAGGTRPLLEDALLIRAVETGLYALFGKGKLHGTIHTCVGQEFYAVMVAGRLTERDFITSNHRCHGHFIAATGNWHGLIDEIVGNASSEEHTSELQSLMRISYAVFCLKK